MSGPATAFLSGLLSHTPTWHKWTYGNEIPVTHLSALSSFSQKLPSLAVASATRLDQESGKTNGKSCRPEKIVESPRQDELCDCKLKEFDSGSGRREVDSAKRSAVPGRANRGEEPESCLWASLKTAWHSCHVWGGCRPPTTFYH